MLRRSLMLVALTTACGGTRSAPPATSPSSTAAQSAPPPPAEPASLRYAAGTGRYKVETSLHMVQDMMGSLQEMSSNMTMILSTSLTDDGGNLLLAATLDSIAVTGSLPTMDASSFASARGKTFRALFTPAGRPLPPPPSADSADALAAQLGRGVREFLAVLPAAIAAGAAWTDTVAENTPIPGGAGSMATRSVRNNRVVGWETRDGVRALHLAVNGTFSITGSGTVQGGTAVEMSGNGTATSDRWVSAAGVLLTSTGVDSTNLTVNVPSVGMSIPIRQTQRTTITRLP